MKNIDDRLDIIILVNAFYTKIRKNDLLGPIFNDHIPKEKWPVHHIKLTDFWETNLFGVARFKGNPTQKHINVDRNLHHRISQAHFEKWLQLWFETIDELYEGETAEKAKKSAKRMGQAQFMMILQHRSKHNTLN